MFDANYQIWQNAPPSLSGGKSHNFHPILFYFRLRETHSLVSQRSLITLDSISLLKSALDEKEFSGLKHSAAVEELRKNKA